MNDDPKRLVELGYTQAEAEQLANGSVPDSLRPPPKAPKKARKPGDIADSVARIGALVLLTLIIPSLAVGIYCAAVYAPQECADERWWNNALLACEARCETAKAPLTCLHRCLPREDPHTENYLLERAKRGR